VLCICTAAEIASPQVVRNRRLMTATANEAVYLVGALFFTEEEMIDELNRRRSSR
jgi:hypothetical protein